MFFIFEDCLDFTNVNVSAHISSKAGEKKKITKLSLRCWCYCIYLPPDLHIEILEMTQGQTQGKGRNAS